MAMKTLDEETLMTLAEEFPETSREAWMSAVEAALKGASFDKVLTRQTYEGLKLQPIYTGEDVPAGRTAPTPGGDRTETGWDVRQMQAHGDPAEVAKTAKQDLERGATSVLLRVDRPGVEGVVVGSVDDLDKALAGVHLNMAPVALDAGAYAPAVSSMLEALWARRGCDAGEVSGSFRIDPLGTLAREGWLPKTAEDALAEMAEIAKRTAASHPKVRSVAVDTAPYYEAGANEVQDLAFAMATGIAYLRALTAAGLDVASAAKQIEFTFALGVDVFQGIGKLRAARRLWARVLEASGADPVEAPMSLHVVTAERAIAGRDVWVNMLRATVSTFAAGVGGADSLTVLPYDHAVGLPDGFARRIARNTQIILMEESGLHRVTDPAGGSWYVETLSDEYAVRAWDILQSIEADGGMVAALASGRVASMVADGWAERERNLARRKDEVTGVSTFPNLSEETAVGVVCDRDALRGALGQGPLPDRAKAGVEMAPLARHTLGEGFEALRAASDAALEKSGARPRIFQLNLGTPADYTARGTFAQNYFAAGGIESIPAETGGGDLGAAFEKSGCRFAVLCSSDKIYGEAAVETAEVLKKSGAERILLAGRPGDNEDAWRAAGIDGFIYVGDQTLATLRDLAAGLGVIEQ
ncbi:methylmalonyl-CoA mutase subunit beta [Nisaea nitritireducens]|uniref:methylmalonyl-CoA mutase subunit beta n=1 Tax=Nisaea nitritireducens TaxID=568392 RepID=UPI001D033468|nr:methylmalonyl-CoA mutase subunit beta [Nisaea nitritireducens]